MAQESYSMRHLQGLNITFLPDSPISSTFTTEITVLRHALGWSLQHHSTCPFIPLVVFYELPILPLPPGLSLKPLCPKCCVDNLVLNLCLSDLAQLSFDWIPGHCKICPNEVVELLAKTGNGIPSCSLHLRSLVSANP